MLQTKRADFNAIAARFHISPVTARIIRNRDVEGEKAIDRYLNGTLDQLYDPHLMKDMDKAAALILEKIRAGVRIRIVGDYDIDGVTAMASTNLSSARRRKTGSIPLSPATTALRPWSRCVWPKSWA